MQYKPSNSIIYDTNSLESLDGDRLIITNAGLKVQIVDRYANLKVHLLIKVLILSGILHIFFVPKET